MVVLSLISSPFNASRSERTPCLAVLAKKSVKQRFDPDERVLQLIETFRRMTNECIRIGLAEGKTSLKSLSIASYPKLKTYDVSSAYKLCAISKAIGILNRYRKLSREHHVKEPYCSRKSLTTCYGVRVNDGKLRMRGGVEIPLNAYVRQFLSDADLEVRSATLTTDLISISVENESIPSMSSECSEWTATWTM